MPRTEKMITDEIDQITDRLDGAEIINTCDLISDALDLDLRMIGSRMIGAIDGDVDPSTIFTPHEMIIVDVIICSQSNPLRCFDALIMLADLNDEMQGI